MHARPQHRRNLVGSEVVYLDLPLVDKRGVDDQRCPHDLSVRTVETKDKANVRVEYLAQWLTRETLTVEQTLEADEYAFSEPAVDAQDQRALVLEACVY